MGWLYIVCRVHQIIKELEKEIYEFKKELGKLIDKYHVKISFDCSESSGISGLHKGSLVIVDRYTNKGIFMAHYSKRIDR